MTLTAIILKRSPVREHDQRIVLYGPDIGRTTAIAKGSLRPSSRQALALDEGNLISCDLVAGRSERAIMTGAQAQRCWGQAKSASASWVVAQYLLQVLDAVVYEDQPDYRLWAAAVGILEELDAGTEPLVVLRHGQVAVLEALGYGRRPVPRPLPVRNDLDDEFERIAQRRLASLDLMYSLAR